MSAPSPPPAQIGPYRVIRPIAQGGMAAVYEVEDDETGQRLALKLLTQRGLARPRFHREYRALTRLDHPHIVRVYRFGVDDDGHPFLTMELLEGNPAQVHAKELGRPGTPKRTAEVLRIVRDVASALAYLHERGIVHRDLKSSNVMVLNDGTVRLLDFGTARFLRTQDEITRHGEFVGTFAYAPPEQLTGGTVDSRSDLYSLGVLLYRLLTGKRPFEGDNPHDLARLHLEHVPPAPADLVAGVSASVSALVGEMLQKDPDDRPPTAWGIYERLDQELSASGRDVEGADEAAPELIGREAALDAVHQLLEAPRPGALLLLSGEPGSGREALLEHARREADRRGGLRLEADFADGAGPEALAAIGRRAGRGLALAPEAAQPMSVVGLIGSGGADAPSPDAIGAALARLVALRARFDGVAAVVVLRALDRAAPAALAALAALWARVAEESLPLVGVASASPDSTAPGGPLARALPAARALELGPVTPHQMDRLTFSVLGRRPPPPGLARRLLRATGGMPGHAVEVLHAMVREGLLARTVVGDSRPTWEDRSGGRVAIPPRISADLQLRVEALAPAARRLLDALSVAGVAVSPTALGRATELADTELARAVEELDGSGLVVRQGDRLRPQLGLTEQLVRERMRESRRRLLRERLAEVLLETAPSEGKVRLLLDAGHLERAVDDAVAWADERLAAHEAAAVLPLLRRVADRAADAEVVPLRLRARLLLLVGRAFSEVAPDDPQGAEALDAAAALADDPLLASVDLERAALARRAGRHARAHELLERTRQRLERHPDASVRHRLLEEEASRLAAAGEAVAAMAAWRRCQAAAGDIGDSAGAARARLGLANALAQQGSLAEAHALAHDAWMELRALGDEAGAWLAATTCAGLLREEGRLSEALAAITPLIELARSWGGPVLQARLQIELAHCRIALLRLGEVRDLLSEVDALGVRHTLPELRARAGGARGLLLLASDDPAGAVAALQPAVQAAQAGGFVVLADGLRASLGEALVLAGQEEDGLRAIRAAIGGLRRLRALPAQAHAIAALQRAMGPRQSEDDPWDPVAPWLDAQPARLLHLERALGELEGAVNRLPDAVVAERAQRAEACLEAISAQLAPSERAALRVHPWRSRIRRCVPSERATTP